MRKLYEIFVYSGFRTFPHEIMALTDSERKVVLTFLERAKERNELPVVLGNFQIKKGGG